MILVTSGGTYRVGSHHSFPEESVRIKRDDKKAKRCCLVIHWCLNSLLCFRGVLLYMGHIYQAMIFLSL